MNGDDGEINGNYDEMNGGGRRRWRWQRFTECKRDEVLSSGLLYLKSKTKALRKGDEKMKTWSDRRWSEAKDGEEERICLAKEERGRWDKMKEGHVVIGENIFQYLALIEPRVCIDFFIKNI